MKKSWEEFQLGEAVKRVKAKFGPTGWNMLGDDLRSALVKAEVLSVIAAGADFETTPQGKLAALACQWGE
jgi:hypothetical protein